MFQQTIQDVLSLAEAAGRPEEVLRCVHARISSFETFECGELLAQTPEGLRRFVVAPGLGEAGPQALAALGDQPTLRIDTVDDVRARGLSTGSGLGSLLILGLGAPGVTAAAIVLGHSRAWSFAGAPISRVRTIGQIALRLLWQPSNDLSGGRDIEALSTEVNRLRAQVSLLEAQLAGPRPGQGKKG